MGAVPPVTQHKAQGASIRPARCTDVARPPDPGPDHSDAVVLADCEQFGFGIEATRHPLRSTGHGQVRVRVDHAGYERGARRVDQDRVERSRVGARSVRPEPCDAAVVDEQRDVVAQCVGRSVGQRGSDQRNARGINSRHEPIIAAHCQYGGERQEVRPRLTGTTGEPDRIGHSLTEARMSTG